MADIFNIVSDIYKQLKASWEKKDFKSVGENLEKVKPSLTKLEFLPLNVADPKTKDVLVLTRDVLEIGAFYSLESQNLAAFDRFMAQLRCYYFDYAALIDKSPVKFELLGLHLLRQLSMSQVSDFHTELELLPFEEIQNNIFISYPVSLEQNLMEGSYHKVFAAKAKVPSKYYTFFVDKLIETIRKEIALAIEKSYKTISEDEAARLLFVQKPALGQFVQSQMGWTRNAKNEFTFKVDPLSASEKRLPANQIAFQMLGYAREMEKIV